MKACQLIFLTRWGRALRPDPHWSAVQRSRPVGSRWPPWRSSRFNRVPCLPHTPFLPLSTATLCGSLRVMPRPPSSSPLPRTGQPSPAVAAWSRPRLRRRCGAAQRRLALPDIDHVQLAAPSCASRLGRLNLAAKRGRRQQGRCRDAPPIHRHDAAARNHLDVL